MHESWTVSYAGTFQFTELQYWMRELPAGAHQRRASTLFVNDSYTRSKPGTEILQLLEYKTRGDLFEAGLSYPFIRQREKQRDRHRAVLHQQRPQRHPRLAQHARPASAACG